MPLEQKPDCPRPLLDRFSNLQKLVPTKPCPCRYRTDHHAAGIRSRSQLQGPVPGFPLHACTLHHWQRTLFLCCRSHSYGHCAPKQSNLLRRYLWFHKRQSIGSLVCRAPFIEGFKKLLILAVIHRNIGLRIREITCGYFAMEFAKGGNTLVMDLFV